MENKDIKRQAAIKTKINDILNGEYKKGQGLNPNYIITDYGKISRVNIIAVVISNDEEQNLYGVDDGSGSINLKSFDKEFDVNIGDVVLVIGKPREWNSQKYILPEIIKKIEDKRWVEIRKKELERRKIISLKRKEFDEEEFIESPYQRIIDIIKELDSGEGADFEEVVVKSKIADSQDLITGLLEQGEIFEVRPGRLKILE
jgi:RPA family protein